MKASVIIPCRDSESTIAGCLESVLAEEFDDDFEIIVVHNNSLDHTRDALVPFEGRCKVLDSDCKNAAMARNVGIAHSKGEILVFLDSDCIPDKGWLKQIVRPFKDSKIFAVGGSVHAMEKKTLIQRYCHHFSHSQHEFIKRKMPFFATANLAVRSKLMQHFDESMMYCEDNEIFQRILQEEDIIHYEKSAIIRHCYDKGIFPLLARAYRYGYWSSELRKRDGYCIHNPKKPLKNILKEHGTSFLFIKVLEASAFRIGILHSLLS